MVITLLFTIFILIGGYLIIIFLIGVRQPHLSRFYIERVQKAHLYTNRTFYSLVSL